MLSAWNLNPDRTLGFFLLAAAAMTLIDRGAVVFRYRPVEVRRWTKIGGTLAVIGLAVSGSTHLAYRIYEIASR
ncbi:MAG: hypothetical protein O2884_09400 [Chloroflexi bacterium]|nr:hypothetical protein [Chloroflexota bacterium]